MQRSSLLNPIVSSLAAAIAATALFGAPAAEAVATVPAAVAAPATPGPGGALVRIEPIPRRPIGDDEPYPATPQEIGAARPGIAGALMYERVAPRNAPAAAPVPGSFADRIIRGRARSYALTNVTTDATNTVWKSLYREEPDLRDYHPMERPEHVPAQEDANRQRVVY